jgi:hypothetical protein
VAQNMEKEELTRALEEKIRFMASAIGTAAYL